MAGPDMSVLVAAATDWSAEISAVLAVAGALLVVHVAWKGAKMLLDAVRGGGGYEFDPDGFSSDDPWEGYTAEDDKRDRKAAGLE